MIMKNLSLIIPGLLFLLFLSIPSSAQLIVDLTNGKNIGDASITVFSTEVETTEAWQKLILNLDVSHTWVNDLEVTVINPMGKRAVVFSNLGEDPCFGCGGDDILMYFFDQASLGYEALNQGCENAPAYSGEAQPIESLDYLLSDDVNGVWTVEILDLYPFETGRANDIQLIFDRYYPPECSQVLFPQPGASHVAINSGFQWVSNQDATGYYLNLGLTPGGYELLDHFDVGSDTTFFFPDKLDCGTDYFFSVIPYNTHGMAENCTDISFSTEYVEAHAQGSYQMCLGDSLVLSASGGDFYQWIPEDDLTGTDSNHPVFTGAMDASYLVIASNQNDCRDTAWVEIKVNGIFIEVDSIDHVRLNSLGFIHLKENSEAQNYTWEWIGPDGFYAHTRDIDSLQVGCYQLFVVDTITACRLDTLMCVDDLTQRDKMAAKNSWIFPNPVHDDLWLSWNDTNPGAGKIQILMPDGRVLLEKRLPQWNDEIYLSTRDLSPGWYLLKFISEKEASMVKIWSFIKS